MQMEEDVAALDVTTDRRMLVWSAALHSATARASDTCNIRSSEYEQYIARGN